MKKRLFAIILVLTMLISSILSLSSCLEIKLPEVEDDEAEDENENNIKKEHQLLLAVMPEAKDFEEIDVSALGLPESITNAYKETSGKGYVFRVTSTGYKSGMVVMIGIDAEGKITGTKCIETQDTFKKEPELDGSYNGQTLDSFAPNMITGATMTSTGYRDAVNTALQSFVLASGGTIDPSLTIIDLLPTVAPGYTLPAEVEASGNMKKAYKAANDAGFAYIFSDGENAFLAVVNATGACSVFDAEANDVTAAQSALADEAKAHAAANQKSYTEDLSAKITELIPDAAEITAIEVPTFGTLVSAVSFKSADAVYYGFYSRSVGFDQMDVYVIIDSNGAIVKTDAKEYIFVETDFIEYGGGIFKGLNRSEYKAKFEGLTTDSWGNGDAAVIAGATKTTDAVKVSVNDAFAAFNSIKGGAQ